MSKYKEALENIKRTVTLLIKAKNKAEVASDKYCSLDVFTSTQKQLANASDKHISACEDVYRLQDELHAYLVDANLTSLKDLDSYKTVLHDKQCGLGHRITVKYTPKLPLVVQDYEKHGVWCRSKGELTKDANDE